MTTLFFLFVMGTVCALATSKMQKGPATYTKTDILSVKMAFYYAYQHHTPLAISFWFTNPTEIVIHKCGKPLLLHFPTTKTEDILPAETVRKIGPYFDRKCGNESENALEVTYCSLLPIQEGWAVGGPRNRSAGIYPVKFHDITPDVISNVSFALLANSSNIYPIKIGTLLCEATRQNLTLKLTVESTTPISFYFSKCGFKITHLPVTTDNTVYLDYKQVRFLKMLQNEQCQKPWMNNIMELELKADTFDAEGSIRFEVVNMVKEQENFDIFVIRVTLIALVISAIICCAIMIVAFFVNPGVFM